MHQARRFGDKTLSLAKSGGVWESKTWRQALEMLPAGVMGLVDLGFKKGDTVGIASRTRREWSEADLTILTAGGVTVGLYPSASLWEMTHIVSHSGLQICFVEDDALLDKLLAVQAKTGLPKTMILFETNRKSLPAGVITLEALIARGRSTHRSRPDAFRNRLAGRPASRSGDDCLYLRNNGTTQGSHDHPRQSLSYGHQRHKDALLRRK